MKRRFSLVWFSLTSLIWGSPMAALYVCASPPVGNTDRILSTDATSAKISGHASRQASSETATDDFACTLQRDSPVRFLALGDSYTIGQGVDESERWPVYLAGLLRDKGIAVAKPIIIAQSGWTTSNLLAGIDREKPSGTYDLVSVLIGVNDQVRGISMERYREKLTTVLDRATALADNKPAHVLVMSVPDWSVAPIARVQDPERIRSEIDQVNQINRVEAEQRGMPYVDITPLSRQAADDPTLLAKDNLHSSGKMYMAWARKALPVACQALAEP